MRYLISQLLLQNFFFYSSCPWPPSERIFFILFIRPSGPFVKIQKKFQKIQNSNCKLLILIQSKAGRNSTGCRLLVLVLKIFFDRGCHVFLLSYWKNEIRYSRGSYYNTVLKRLLWDNSTIVWQTTILNTSCYCYCSCYCCCYCYCFFFFFFFFFELTAPTFI